MNRRIISMILSVFVLALCFAPCALAAEESAGVIYVSPHGNDSAAGTIESPLRTLEGAKTRVRELKAKGVRVSEVVFRGGDYRMRTVEFTADDSGTSSNPIVYRAYEGETPRFKGSVELDASQFKPLTDTKVLSKLKEDVRDKVIELDLAGQKISAADIFNPVISATSYCLNGDRGDYNSIFIDNIECQIAQWPNGRNYASWGSNINSQTITYTEADPDKWAEEKEWWMLAFNSHDYAMTRVTPTSVNPENKTITVPSNITLRNMFSKRWKAYNLLQELDMPGEYYIDRNAMKLYIYVPHSIANSTIELAVEGYALISTKGLSDVTFRGISFEQTKGNAVRNIDVKNVDFENCTFKNIGDKALRYNGSKKVVTGASHWQGAYGYADGAYDCDVRGCYFNNMGSSAIYTTGGNQDTLTPSGNIIEDNIICAANQRYTIDSALIFTGCGITLRNNVVTKSSQHGLQIYGNNHVVEDNEFSDVLREVGDAGVIYQGQHQLNRGTILQRNLIHNVVPKDPRIVSGTCGIYMDDGQQGNTILNNMIIGIKGNGYNSNQGAAMNFSNNVIVDCTKGWAFHQNGSPEKDVFDKSFWGTIDDMLNDLANKELYFEAYPDLKKWCDTKNNPRVYTTIRENLLVGCTQTAIGTEEQRYATIEDNIILEETDAFVDPEKADYRLKSDSELAKLLPGSLTDKSYDIEQNGVKTDMVFTTENTPFRILYPQNGGTVSPVDLKLYWQDVGPANQYRLEVGTDPQFTNKVFDDIVYFNIHEIENLLPNTRYYWRVTAQNTTRDLACEWGHDGNVYSFVTSVYTPLRTENIDYAIKTAEESMSTAVEGTYPGSYKIGSVDNIRRYIELTRKLLMLRTGMFGQDALDIRTDYIGNYFKNKSLVNRGYVDLFDYAKPQYWRESVNHVSSEYIAMENLNSATGTMGLGHMSGSVVYCYDAEIMANSFTTMGLNMDTANHLHSGANRGYYLCIKKNVVELQKTDGSKNEVLMDRAMTIGDGSRHSIQFGVINTSTGNYVVAVIDGETVFEYMDVSDTTARDITLEFGLGLYTAEGSYIKLYPSESIPGQDEFDALVNRAELMAARTIMESFPEEFSYVSNIKDKADVILTDEGIIDVSYASPELLGDSMMVPADSLEKIMGIEVKKNNGETILSKEGTSAVFYEDKAQYTIDGHVYDTGYAPYLKNGYLMVSMLDVAEIFGYEITDDWLNDMAIVSKTGAFNVVNDSAFIRKIVEVIDGVPKYAGGKDVWFKNIG